MPNTVPIFIIIVLSQIQNCVKNNLNMDLYYFKTSATNFVT